MSRKNHLERVRRQADLAERAALVDRLGFPEENPDDRYVATTSELWQLVATTYSVEEAERVSSGARASLAKK